MNPVLIISQKKELAERLRKAAFHVVAVSTYEEARKELSGRHFDFLVSARLIPLTASPGLKLDVLQFFHWASAHRPLARLIMLSNKCLAKHQVILGKDHILPEPESDRSYRRVSLTLRKFLASRKPDLPPNTNEIITVNPGGELESFRCPDEEIRRDLLDFLMIKGKNFSEILKGGAWSGVSWSGESEVELLRSFKGSLLAIESGSKKIEWPREVKARIYRDFGRTLP